MGARNKKSLAIISSLILVTGIIFSNFGYAQEETDDEKAKNEITKSIGSAVEGSWSSIEMINISKPFANDPITVYNKTLEIESPPQCNENENLENGVCVPDTSRLKEICDDGKDNDGDGRIDENCKEIPLNNDGTKRDHTSVILAGDLCHEEDCDFGGDPIANAINKRVPNLFVGLGDLGYERTLDWFRETFTKDAPDGLGNRATCIIGNHDDKEKFPHGAPIIEQAIETCGTGWYAKIANETTLVLGFNTINDALKIPEGSQIKMARNVLSNSTLMEGVKNLFILTHKPCFTHPNSDHSVSESRETKRFCEALRANLTAIPDVKILYISGHNHEIASTTDGTKFVSGGGGQDSHQECDTDGEWDFCDTKFGFLEFRIDNKDGSFEWDFLDEDADVIHGNQ